MSADKLKDEGNALLTAGDFVGASNKYTEAIAIQPLNHVLYSNRSASKLKGGDTDGAIKDAERCVQLNAKWPKGFSRLGAALYTAQKWDESLTAYATGLSLEPSSELLQQGMKSALESKNKATANAQMQSSHAADPIIGIDLGTTFSCVGVWENREDFNGVTIIPDSEGRRTTPSVVSYQLGENGQVERLVGHDAKRKMTTNSDGTIFDAKRLIGQRFSDVQVQKDVERFPFKVEAGGMDEKPTVSIPKLSLKFTPEEISAVILAEMKKIAEAYLKKSITRAIVTVPAYFSDAQRQATKDAGAIAGLNVLRVINEPTAAALAYGLDARSVSETDTAEDLENKKKERKILVFDLGGGTFDVSVLSIENGVFEVMSTGGDTHLGGEDFDINLADHLMKEIKNKYKIENLEQKKKARLKVAAEQAKINLSNGAKVRVPLDGIVDGEDMFVEVTREKFDALNAEPFKRCMDTVNRVLKDAKLKPEHIADVVLVGGSTRIPTIREKLRAVFNGKQLCQSINPDEAVAYGAAVQGAIMSRASAATSDLILVDVCPLSMGIECTGRVFSVVIPRNTALPVKRTKTYSTEEDNQTAIDVRIFEGERQVTDSNNFLGEFMITGIERAKRGVPQIEVTFSISVDGILNVSARDTKTGAVGNVQIAANSGRLSQDDIAKMLADAEKYRKEDEARTKRLEAVNELENMLGEISEMSSSQAPKAVRGRAQKVREWLEAGGKESGSTVEIKQRMSEIWGERGE